ncbi:hypothetical protein AB1Y20_020218 [Prymnesium parvum]|uniref:Uncharacterized protein n=1 Tax=Prymnesium parvum TaxID=97485 RepID=A0AB34JWG9_PRYPA
MPGPHARDASSSTVPTSLPGPSQPPDDESGSYNPPPTSPPMLDLQHLDNTVRMPFLPPPADDGDLLPPTHHRDVHTVAHHTNPTAVAYTLHSVRTVLATDAVASRITSTEILK